jgi:Holliday junction resolvase RusA-like endonuclease
VTDDAPILVQVVGKPMPWKSYSPSSATGRGYVSDPSGRLESWKHAIFAGWLKVSFEDRERAKDWAKRRLAIELVAQFRLRKPRTSKLLFPTGKPDRSNYLKYLEDRLTDCGVWPDDSVVIKGSSIKLWAKPHESPGATVLIRPYRAP